MSKRNSNVEATIYTANVSVQLKLDLKKFNVQYPKVEVKTFTKSHDRFLIIDSNTVYHIGASLKDLVKKPVVSLPNYGLLSPKSNSTHQKSWENSTKNKVK